MPFLTFPLALIGLIAVPAVIGIYFLRNRYRPKAVSSLFLWEVHTRSQEGGPRVTNMQFPLSLLLELLILTSLIFAAADPRWRVSTRLRPLLVVLDDSASMSIVKDEVLEILENEVDAVDYERIRLVFAGTSPRVAGAPVSNWSELKPLLERWTCAAPAAELSTAIALAEDLGDKNTRILVISDHKPGMSVEEGERLVWRAVGKARPNVGFVNAGRTPSSGADRCYFEIGNFSKSATSTTLRVDERPPQTVDLKAGEIKRVLIATPEALAGKPVEAHLSEDALDADNHATLVADEPRPVKIMVNCKDAGIKRLVDKGLKASGHTTFGKVDPKLMIVDHAVPELDNDERWVFEIFPEKDAQAFAGPFILKTEHPLAEGIELIGSVWGAAPTNRTEAADMDPVVAIGNTALLAARPPRVRMHFKPAMSTLQDNANWPILLWNLRNWRASYLPGLSESNVRVGAELDVRVAPGVSEVVLKGPDSTQTITTKQRTIRLSPDGPGVHQVTAGPDTFSFAANLLSPGESDLQQADSGTWGKWIDQGVLRKEYKSTAWIWLLIALAAFLAHLWLVTRRRQLA